MPFTFAHPALILPLRYLPRSWFSFTGLITGSMVPDLEYIINGTRTFSHTYQGILWFHLPLALIVAFIFHNILRDKLISRLPAFMYSRFTRFEGFNWNGYFKKNKGIVIFSIILGAFTHLFWDDFTNVSGYFVMKFPVLQKMVYVAGTPMPLYVLVWDVSSVAGMLALFIAIYLLPKEYKNRKYSIVWLWIIFITVAVLLYCLVLFSWRYVDMEAVFMIFLRSGLLLLLLIAVFSKKKTISNKM
jgi:Domain of unknown function (DUF4184)